MLSYFSEAVDSYIDIHDRKTRNVILSLDEADQNSVLLSLTGKLYQMIIDKVDDIDFGDIPDSKGDVTLLAQYGKIRDCIDTLTKILQQYKQPLDTIDTIRAALDNIENDRDIYKRGFQTGVEIIKTTYNSIVLAIIDSISYMIAVTVEYIKNPNNDGYKVVFDRAGIARTKDSLVYSNLASFNEACRKGQISNAFRPLIKAKVKNLAATSLLLLSTGIAIAGILVNILPILREITYFFFSGRVRIAQYFSIQADLLEMNAEMLKSGELDSIDDTKRVAKRQQAIADRFRSISNFFALSTKEADKKSTSMIKSDTKMYQIDDIVDTIPDSASDSLF